MDEACVLTFHRVVPEATLAHDISWESFSELLDRLSRCGRPCDADLTPPGTPGRERHVVLTFDDGTEDHLAAARELARRDVRAIFFVAPADVGTPGHLTLDGLRELHSLRHEVGAHGYLHRPLGPLSRAEVDTEVKRSRDALARALGSEVQWFAPPGGVSSPYLVERLVRHGFGASRSMRWGIYRSPRERWAVPCVPVTQLTLERGWVDAAVERFELAASMHAAWLVKRAIPARVRGPLRRTLAVPRGGGR